MRPPPSDQVQGYLAQDPPPPVSACGDGGFVAGDIETVILGVVHRGRVHVPHVVVLLSRRGLFIIGLDGPVLLHRGGAFRKVRAGVPVHAGWKVRIHDIVIVIIIIIFFFFFCVFLSPIFSVLCFLLLLHAAARRGPGERRLRLAILARLVEPRGPPAAAVHRVRGRAPLLVGLADARALEDGRVVAAAPVPVVETM